MRVSSRWSRNHFIILKGRGASPSGILVLVKAEILEAKCELCPSGVPKGQGGPVTVTLVTSCCQSTEQPKPGSKVRGKGANKPASLEL